MPAQLLTVSDIGTLVDPAGTAAADVAAHAALTAAHGATSANTASRIVARSATGTATLSGVVIDTAATPTQVAGMLSWNATEETIDVGLSATEGLSIGAELTPRYRNGTGSTLAAGSAVYISGATGNFANVALAQANALIPARDCIGIVTTDSGIANNQRGRVCTYGVSHNHNTSAFADGAEIWLSPTVAGGLTATEPTTIGHFKVLIGKVQRSHATLGEIFVDPHYLGSVTGDAVSSAVSQAAARTGIGAASTLEIASRLRPRPVQMCNRCVNPSAPLTNSVTETQGQSRIFHRSGAAGYTGIQFKYVNRSNASANITDNLTNLGTLTVKAAMEYPSTGGVIYPITFNGGSATVTLPPGGEIWSDPIGIFTTPSATFYERCLVICSGGSFVRGNTGAVARSEGVEIGTSLTDKVYSGTFTFTNNASAYGAVAIRGIPLTSDYGSVVVLMDSLASGVGAATGAEDRGFADKAFSGLYGVCNVAVSGGTLAGWTSTADARWRRQIINDVKPSLIVGGCGGNDLNNVGVTAAQVIALLQTFWTQLRVYRCPIIAWTIPPRTTSTDNWATYANQTVNSPNANLETERLTLNTYLRTQAVADGYVSQVIDFAATVEDGGVVQSGRWKSNGVANTYTSDGAHPNDTGSVNAQALIGALINTSLATAINAY